MTDREIMQQALHHLVDLADDLRRIPSDIAQTIAALEAELAKPEQALVCDRDPFYCWSISCQVGKVCNHAQPEQDELIQFKDGNWSYVRKPWQGLTDEQLSETYNELYTQYTRDDVNIADFILIARTIESQLKELNT